MNYRPPSARDRVEFLQFCRQASDEQLHEIIAKERRARRFTYMQIAEQVAATREQRLYHRRGL